MSGSFAEVVIQAVKLDVLAIKLLDEQYRVTPDRAWVDLVAGIDSGNSNQAAGAVAAVNWGQVRL